jgi:chitodextrinase
LQRIQILANMKHFNSLLRLCLCFSAISLVGKSFAAPPTADPYTFCDFESNTSPATRFHSPAGGGTVTTPFANPHKIGINTSNYVMKVVSPSGANYGGTIFSESHGAGSDMTALYGVDFVTGYDYVDFLIYRENNARIPQLKIVDQDDYGTDLTTLDLLPIAVNDDPNGTIQVGVWQKVTYSITRCHNTGINFIYIMPDREGQSTVYIDNIVFSKDHTPPVMGAAACGGSTPESITLTVSATDNLTDPVRKFMVSQDGTYAHAVEYIANSSGNLLTITGLLPSTTYTFTIWAVDDAGNVSAGYVTQSCTTAPPTPGNWCHRAITQGGHTIYVSCIKRFGTSTYTLLIESDEVMTGLSAGCWCHVNGGTNYNYGTNYTLSNGGKKITCDIPSNADPDFYTSVYVLYPSQIAYAAPTSITWGICATDENPPSMSSVSCGTATASSVSLNVSATDDVTNPVTTYRVSVNGAAANNYTATAGVITISGLSPETTYSFQVWAVDDAGNISASAITQNCSTNSAPAATSNYCHEPITVSGHTIYVTMEEVATNSYRLVIECDEVMSGLGGSFCHVNGNQAYQLNANGHFVISDDGHTITCNISSTTAPDFYTPLYVLIPNEVVFPQLGSGSLPAIQWGQCAVDATPPEMISASVYECRQRSITLDVYATDDTTNPVTDFCVTIGSASSLSCQDYTADGDGRITVTGLDPNTEYCFYVWAKDEAGNMSSNYKVTCGRTQTFYEPPAGTCGDAFNTTAVALTGKFTAYLSLKMTFLTEIEGQYKLTVELVEIHKTSGQESLQSYTDFSFHPDTKLTINGSETVTLSNIQVKSGSPTNVLTCEFESTTTPTFASDFKLYVVGKDTKNNTFDSGKPLTVEASSLTSVVWGTCTWVIYHTGDIQNPGDRVSYAGGTIDKPIQYRRRFTEGAWETLYLPFTVSSVQITDGVDYYDLIAYTGSNKASANYFLRTFNGQIDAPNFKANWTNTTNPIPQKNTPYIIQFPVASGYYANNYIVFNGAANQTIVSSYTPGAEPPVDRYDYYGNNTMMPQTQAGYMLTDDGLWFLSTEGAVTLNPFECYVAANAANRSQMPRFNWNTMDEPQGIAPTLAHVQFIYGSDAEQLYLEALEDVTIRIYSTNGWLMKTVVLRTGEQIYLNLPRGMYILQSIGQTAKVIL